MGSLSMGLTDSENDAKVKASALAVRGSKCRSTTEKFALSWA